MLIDHESCLQLKNTFFSSLNSLIEGHILVECIIKNRIDEVTSITLSSFVNLLQRSKIVHPVKFGSLISMIISTHEQVDVVWSLPQSLGHFSSHVLGSSLDSEFMTSSEFLKSQVPLDKVREHVAVGLLTRETHNLMRANLSNLILIMFERKDRSINCSISNNQSPVLSSYAKCGVHLSKLFKNIFCFI